MRAPAVAAQQPESVGWPTPGTCPLGRTWPAERAIPDDVYLDRVAAVTRTRRPSPQTVAVLTALAADPLAWRHGYEQAAGPLGDMTLFYAWAGAVMLRDLAPRLANAPHNPLARVRRWTNEWKRHAGL